MDYIEKQMEEAVNGLEKLSIEAGNVEKEDLKLKGKKKRNQFVHFEKRVDILLKRLDVLGSPAYREVCAENALLKAQIEDLAGRLEQLQKQTNQAVSASETVLETYKWITGMRVCILDDSNEFPLIECSINTISGESNLTFTLQQSSSEQIDYTPLSHSLPPLSNLVIFKDSITFNQKQGPLFLKKLLNAITASS